MAVITRTPIVDDDGSGTTGTVLDNAWKQELYGQIDALAAALGAAATGPHTILSSTHSDTVPASLAAGDLLIATGSPAKLTRAGIGGAGQILNVSPAGLPAWATLAGITLNPYNAGNFVATGGGTWTVEAADQAQYYYNLIGNMMTIWFSLLSTSITGNVVELRVTMPGTWRIANYAAGAAFCADNGVPTCVSWRALGSGTYISFGKNLLGTSPSFTVSTNLTGLSAICQIIVYNAGLLGIRGPDGELETGGGVLPAGIAGDGALEAAGGAPGDDRPRARGFARGAGPRPGGALQPGAPAVGNGRARARTVEAGADATIRDRGIWRPPTGPGRIWTPGGPPDVSRGAGFGRSMRR